MLSPPCRPSPEVWGCCWQIQACWLTFEVGVGGQFDEEAPSGTLQIRSQIMVAALCLQVSPPPDCRSSVLANTDG